MVRSKTNFVLFTSFLILNIPFLNGYATDGILHVRNQQSPVFFSCRFENHISASRPFDLTVKVKVTPLATRSEIDVTLSDELEALSGNLHWSPRLQSDDFQEVVLTLRMNSLGIHQIDVVLTTDLDPAKQPDNRFPRISYTYYLYARADTVAIYGDTISMQQAILDSLLPHDKAVQHRLEVTRDSIYQAEREQEHRLFVSWLQTDSSDLSNYTPEQVDLIQRHRLVYSAPTDEHITQIINANPFYGRPYLTAPTVRLRLYGVYRFDQQIIHAESSSIRDSLLSERPNVLERVRLQNLP
ncbi:MAG: hypothetical protein OEM52_08980 [bacterium]|nr:hypothetical protein [bacterium]